MMNSNIGFISKVLIASGGLAIAIKYVAPALEISASNSGVLIFVFLPSLVLAIVLAWKARHSSQT